MKPRLEPEETERTETLSQNFSLPSAPSCSKINDPSVDSGPVRYMTSTSGLMILRTAPLMVHRDLGILVHKPMPRIERLAAAGNICRNCLRPGSKRSR
jgi:hypothetical protein